MVNTVRVKDITARERAVVSENIRREANAVKASVNPQQKEYKEKEVIDSGCSRHMTGNKCYLTDYEDYDGGFVSFGDGKGRISGKGKIKTRTLDFDYVYFCKELKYNLFSVSQMCDKKNNVLFTDTECLVLSSNFKLFDESQVLLRVPRKDNIYNVNLKSVVPTGGLTCLFAKATIDESNLWHRRLGHINYKTMNNLVRENLGLNGNSVLLGNGVAKRKNKTLIEATRTMALVIKPHNKTPYEFIRGRPPLTDFIKPFRCPVTILNTRDSLGKFDEKADDGFFVGYYVVSKAMRVFNKRTMIVKETLNIRFLENAPNMKGNGPDWLFDIYSLIISMNYEPVFAGKKTNGIAGTKDNIVVGPKDRTVDAAKKATKVDESRVSDNGGQGDQVTRIAMIEAIRLFLAYASFKDIIVYQMDVKSGFLYEKIEEKVYVCQPPGFKDPDFPDKVYKIEKALYGLHQAPRAWYETLSTYLMDNGFHRGQIDKTLFIKRHKDDILLVQVYVDDIIFGSTKKEMIYGKKVIVNEASIRRDLRLDDAEERIQQHCGFCNHSLANNQKFNFSKYILENMMKNLEARVKFYMFPRFVHVFINNELDDVSHHKGIFFNPFLTKNVFANMKKVGTGFSRVITSLFETMMVQAPEEVGDIPTDTQDIPILTRPSYSQPQRKHKPRRKQRETTEDPQTDPQAEERVHIPSHDPLPSSEDRLQLNKLMDIYTKLSNRVLSLEQTKTNQAFKIKKLKKRVKKLEGKKKKRTHGLKRLYKVGLSARVESFKDEEDLGAQEDASKQGRIADIDANDDLFLIDETAQD
uniref:Ribonuclease H-like domain-containing protein n=1 Tax=Tanacetum cinerariifolium TaxID=118510 RepID=A0A6L2LEQ1_TANCI|nr:ribonuclease H-like domain-containing protein [Tanacetum cinerariifolium]